MIRLRHFMPDEFRSWWPHMSLRLLAFADLFRAHWGHPVQVSPNRKALGRRLGEQERTQHNIDRWGEVRAMDVFVHAVHSKKDAQDAVSLAARCGITGIGIYPHWRPMFGMHWDVRESSEVGQPALWSALDIAEATPDQKRTGRVANDQVYGPIHWGYEAMR